MDTGTTKRDGGPAFPRIVLHETAGIPTWSL